MPSAALRRARERFREAFGIALARPCRCCFVSEARASSIFCTMCVARVREAAGAGA